MSRKEDDNLLAEALVDDQEIPAIEEPTDTPEHTPKVAEKPWTPRLNPTQQEIFDDAAENVVGWGPKGSGKSLGFDHKIVRHCYENRDALVLVISNTARAGYEGFGHDMTSLVLPAWRDGNRDPHTNELLDEGIGLEYTDWKLDPVTKDRHLWIANKHGGWSKILLVSIPYGAQVKARLYQIQPSMVYVEELMNMDGPEYYMHPSSQLGRRRNIVGPQQWMASQNCEAPDHWTYKLLYEDCVSLDRGQPDMKDPEKPGIKRDPRWSVRQVPFEENIRNLPSGYRERLEITYRSDPILKARMIDGKWIAYPSGDALFKAQFSEGRHVRGDLKKKRGLVPVSGYPIVLSYDLGTRNTSISFQQHIKTKEGMLLLIFDELCYVGETIPYRRLCQALLEKMRFWNQWLAAKTPAAEPTANLPTWFFWHIGGDDATTVYQPNRGSTAARDIEQYSRQLIEENPERYAGILPIRIRGCPRPPGSIETRVNHFMDDLVHDLLVVSALCPWHCQMFLHLERDRDNEMEPKPRHKYIHTFDAGSYARFYRHLFTPDGFGSPDDGPIASVA
jgi:hypothetical protein